VLVADRRDSEAGRLIVAEREHRGDAVRGVGLEIAGDILGGVMPCSMPTVLPTWPCALTRPGITVLPASGTREAPARSSPPPPGRRRGGRRGRIVALSMGARSVPSIAVRR
jgi:hypothetical protein